MHMILLHVLIPGIVGHPAWPHATSPEGSGRHRTSLDMDVDGKQALHDLEEDIIVMQDTNKDTAHDNLEDEMDGVRVRPHLRPAIPIFVWPPPSSSGRPHLRPAIPIFVQPSPSLSGCPHLCPAVPIFVWPSHLHPAVPIFVRPSPSLSGHPHLCLAGPPTSSSPSGRTHQTLPACLTLFLDSRMFSFHNRTFLHVLSSSTFYLRLDPQSSILILVTYLL